MIRVRAITGETVRMGFRIVEAQLSPTEALERFLHEFAAFADHHGVDLYPEDPAKSTRHHGVHPGREHGVA